MDLEKNRQKGDVGVLKSGSSPRFGDAQFSLGRHNESGEAEEPHSFSGQNFANLVLS